MTTNNLTAQQEKAWQDYRVADSDYRLAWDLYVATPGDRDQARAELGEARRALDKAWWDYNRAPTKLSIIGVESTPIPTTSATGGSRARRNQSRT